MKKTWKVILLMVFCALLLISPVQGEELTGQEILERLRDDTALTGSGSAILNLITVNSRGAERHHRLQVYRSESEETEKQLLEYLEPADVRGTKFLSIQEKDQDEAQMWLYLPALGRERRIAGHMTEDRFMGTDFTYEEIGSAQNYSDNYQETRLTDEILDDYECYVLQLTPLQDDSDYSQVKMWVWKDELFPLRVEFFNQEERLGKTLTVSELTLQDDGNYMPYYLGMTDNINDTKTIIEILETTREDVPERYFTLQYLRR